MRVAILTLTRDRLAYTRHCFSTLRWNAGCEFDWYVLDQGSEDGTDAWLLSQGDLDVTLLRQNVGICQGLNLLLEEALNAAEYDVIVRFDNDCEVLQPSTLATVAGIAYECEMIVAPRVLGLRQPPRTLRTIDLPDGHTVDETEILGGVFMAIPAQVFSRLGYRFDESSPPYAGDEAVTTWWRRRGGTCGYVHDVDVNHYLTTDGQAVDDVAYWGRKTREMVA